MTLETEFCLKSVEESLARLQARDFQYRSRQSFYEYRLHEPTFETQNRFKYGRQEILVSNVFVERLWQTIKYEEVYLRAYNNVQAACSSLGRYIDGFYNTNRPHSSIDNKTPDEAYFNKLSPISLAA